MKKYIARYTIAITLFFASIASAMDHPSEMLSLPDILATLQALPNDSDRILARGNSSMLADSYIPLSENIRIRTTRRFQHRNIDIINPVRFSFTTLAPTIRESAKNHNKRIPLI